MKNKETKEFVIFLIHFFVGISTTMTTKKFNISAIALNFLDAIKSGAKGIGGVLEVPTELASMTRKEQEEITNIIMDLLKLDEDEAREIYTDIIEGGLRMLTAILRINKA